MDRHAGQRLQIYQFKCLAAFRQPRELNELKYKAALDPRFYFIGKYRMIVLTFQHNKSKLYTPPENASPWRVY